jgi:uncharacterized protein with PIN domain
MRVISTNDSYLSYGIACIRCNDRLIAPNCSEYVSELHVRHFWFCDNCEHQFETSDHLRFGARSKVQRKIPHRPLLVA